MARVVLSEDLRRQGYLTMNAAADQLGTTKATLNKYIWERGIRVSSFVPRETPYEIVKLSDLGGFDAWRGNGSGQSPGIPKPVGGNRVGAEDRAEAVQDTDYSEQGSEPTEEVGGEGSPESGKDQEPAYGAAIEDTEQTPVEEYIEEDEDPETPVEIEDSDYLLLDDFAEKFGVPAADVEALFKYDQLTGKGLKGEERQGKIYIARQGSREIVTRYKTDSPWFDEVLDFMDEQAEEKEFGAGVVDAQKPEPADGETLDGEDQSVDEETIDEEGDQEAAGADVVIDEETGEVAGAEPDEQEEEAKPPAAKPDPPPRLEFSPTNRNLTPDEIDLFAEMSFDEFKGLYRDFKNPYSVWRILSKKAWKIRREQEE